MSQLPFAGQDDGHGIVGGNAQVGGHVQRRTKADDHDADDQAEDPDQQRRGRQQDLQKFIGKLGDVAQQEQVDEGGDADIPAVSNQAEHQQHQVYQHIQCAEGDGDHVIQTTHQGLERVYAQCGDLKHTDADGANENACQRHKDSSSFQDCSNLSVIYHR